MEQSRLREAETIARGVIGLERPTLVMKLPALTALATVRARLGEADADEPLARALKDASDCAASLRRAGALEAMTDEELKAALAAMAGGQAS